MGVVGKWELWRISPEKSQISEILPPPDSGAFCKCAPKTFPEPLRVFDTFSPNPSHHPILAHFPNLSLGYLTSAVAPLAHHPSLRVAALLVFLVFMVTLLCFFASARIVLVSSYLRRLVSPSVQPVRQTFLVCRLGSWRSPSSFHRRCYSLAWKNPQSLFFPAVRSWVFSSL